MTDVTEGMVLKAEMTGYTYRVQSVEGDTVHVSGLPPVSKRELERDIDAGKIEIL